MSSDRVGSDGTSPALLTKTGGDDGVMFLALARNCANHLPRLFRILDEAEDQGFFVRCLIGENGSTDNTRNCILARASEDRRVSLISTEAMSKGRDRLTRMAIGREIMRVAWAGAFCNEKFVCVVDVDNVLPRKLGRVDLRAAVNLLRADPTIAGISASSSPFYYDLLALRVPGLFNYDLGPALGFGRRDLLFHYLVHKRLIYPMQRTVTARLPLKTSSSFNGMSLYRAADYAAASYVRSHAINECEHVDFHRQLCVGGRHILAGSWFDLDMPTEHGPRGLAGFIGQRLAKLGRSG